MNPLLPNQDTLFAAPFHLLQDAVATLCFSSASVAITYQDRLVALKAFGKLMYSSDATIKSLRESNFEVTPATLFDLASVTKVVSTTTMAMLLYERGILDLDAPASTVVPEFITGSTDLRRRNVTL